MSTNGNGPLVPNGTSQTAPATTPPKCRAEPSQKEIADLTPNQQRTLTLLREGRSPKEIATTLGISRKALNARTTKIRKVLGVADLRKIDSSNFPTFTLPTDMNGSPVLRDEAVPLTVAIEKFIRDLPRGFTVTYHIARGENVGLSAEIIIRNGENRAVA